MNFLNRLFRRNGFDRDVVTKAFRLSLHLPEETCAELAERCVDANDALRMMIHVHGVLQEHVEAQRMRDANRKEAQHDNG